MTRPRREFMFNTVQTSEFSDYVPSKTRRPELMTMFEGGNPGVVIAWQQKVAALSAERTFGSIVEKADGGLTADVSDLFAVTTMGTAYHTFAQHSSDEVGHRRIKLPVMYDPETEHRTTQGELIAKAQHGLAHAAELAVIIEEMVYKGRSPELIAKKNLILGRSLATTGVTLAVIKGEVADLQLNESGVQEEARLAAQASYEKSINLTKLLGTRPTLAQFADERSPLMQHLSSNEDSVTQPVYVTLVSEIAVAEEQSLRTTG